MRVLVFGIQHGRSILEAFGLPFLKRATNLD